MDEAYRLFCPACRAAQEAQALRCAACGGLLGVALLRALQPGEPHPFAHLPGVGPMWRSNPVLPITHADSIVSLGEGGTPCVPAAHLSAEKRVCVWLKNEACNPTGSFKDRQVSVGISHARELTRASPGELPSTSLPRSCSGQVRINGGATQFYVVSSGNVAAAAAAYCARAGATCWVIAPEWAPAGKLLQIQLCGARVVRVQGASAEQLFRLAEEAAAEFGWHPLSTAARSNPFNIIGARTIAGEVVEQMPPPDWVIVPVGGGGLLGSLWQGFQEASRLRPAVQLPRLAAVQPRGCAPLVRAVEQGWSVSEVHANPWQNVETIAGGLADDIPFDAHLALPAIRESNGLALAVSDDEIRHAQRLLAAQEGLFIEPSGVVGLAGLLRLIGDGRIAAGARVCCVLTGSGLKDLASIGELPAPPVIAAQMSELRRVVEAAR
jgi:threonine synthase